MTNSQIKAELRRSACEDRDPFFLVSHQAYSDAWQFLFGHEGISLLDFDDQRTFFLLVAEALED